MMQTPNQPNQPGSELQADDLDPQEPLDQQAKWFAEYKNKPYKEIAERMVALKKLADEHEALRLAAAAEFDVLRLRVVPTRFQEDGMSSLRLDGIGRLGLTSDAYCTVIPGAKPDLINWLKAHPDWKDVVKEDINSSTLKSIVKGMAEEATESQSVVDLGSALDAEPVPEEELPDFEKIKRFVNFTPFMRASVTKS